MAVVAGAFALLGAAPAYAEPPTIICPPNVVAFADQNGVAFVTPGDATVTGGEGAVTITIDTPAGFFPVGTTLVTYVATDSLGQTDSCTATISVFDVTAPSITCPPNITADAGAGGTAVVTYSVQASDNAGGVTIFSTHPSGSEFSIGETAVTATATDESGNTSTCVFTVTVNQSLPTSKAECKNGGWKTFGIFKNQGECVELFDT